MPVRGAPASAEIVGSIDDLLIAILLHLPVKSLVRFMSVSKRWKSLITSACFSLQHSTRPSHAVGMFLCGQRRAAFEYVHLDAQNPSKPHFNDLNFSDDPCTFWIHHECNGLLLCCSSGFYDLGTRFDRSPIRVCYIINPTLNLFVKLPRPGVTDGLPRFILGVNLAFDSAKPPYKVVCVRGSELAPDLCQIEIYSTESGGWSLAAEPFRADVNFRAGVYWNGSVHWVHKEGYDVFFFVVDQEKFGTMSLPEIPEGNGLRKIGYFGVSNDKLHLVMTYAGVRLTVYEMETNQANWSMRHQIDLLKHQTDILAITKAFPDTVFLDDFLNMMRHELKIFSLVWENDETAFLVTRILNKVVRIYLKNLTFDEIHELGGRINNLDGKCEFRRGNDIPFRGFEYIQSLCMFRCPPRVDVEEQLLEIHSEPYPSR